MAFSVDTHGLPRIYSYADAASIEANIKPIRGGTVKPLDSNRRKQHINIRREGSNIIVRMYNTDILIYTPTQLIATNGGWSSLSTNKVLSAITGRTFGSKNNKTWLMTRNESDDALYYAMHKGNDYTLVFDGYSRTPDSSYVPPLRTRKNLVALKAIRKNYTEFKKYMRGMCKLLADSNGLITDIPAIDLLHRPTPLQVVDMVANGAELSSLYEGMVFVMDRSKQVQWVGGVWQHIKTTTHTRMLREFERMLLEFNKDTVFYTETAPMGKLC